MDYDGSGITPFLCCPVARFGRTCVWQSEDRGPWDFGLLAMVYRIIGTAGPPLGSPPIREYPGPPSAKGVIIPPARLQQSSQYAPWSRSAVKVLCPAGHGEAPGQQALWGRSGSLVPWLLPKGSVVLIWGPPQTGSPGACSPVACLIGQRDRKQPGYWI